MDIIIGVFFFAFGAIIGSFLNVCIVRLPLDQSIVFPGSHCLKCNKPVRWYDNIPVVSYVLLRGKCRDCGAMFSWRYAFVELLTGCLFVSFYYLFGLSGIVVPYLVLLCGLIIATFVDFEHRIIPDQLSLYGIPAGLLMHFLVPQMALAGGDPQLRLGWVVSFWLIFVCLVLTVLEHVRRKAAMNRATVYFFLVVFTVLILQHIFIVLSSSSGTWAARWAAVASSLQGVIIGGGALYLMGLIGELMIRKRILTLFDLKVLTNSPEDLFKELIHRQYIDEAGEISDKFRNLKSVDEFELAECWQPDRAKIHEMVLSCIEGGVMGGGDVKLMGLVGAFLGWRLAVLTIVLAPFIGAPVGIIEKIRTKSSAIAFGPYLAIAAVVSLVWGQVLIAWFVAGYGL